jgi:hypothetical protein
MAKGGSKRRTETVADMKRQFKKWYDNEFVPWGRKVRIDVIRLEGHAGFCQGDPGDPPDGPW